MGKFAAISTGILVSTLSCSLFGGIESFNPASFTSFGVSLAVFFPGAAIIWMVFFREGFCSFKNGTPVKPNIGKMLIIGTTALCLCGTAAGFTNFGIVAAGTKAFNGELTTGGWVGVGFAITSGVILLGLA